MKKNEKLRILSGLDETYIDEANEPLRFGTGHNLWIKALSVAASLVLICGLVAVPFLKNDRNDDLTKQDFEETVQSASFWSWNKEEGVFEKSFSLKSEFYHMQEDSDSHNTPSTIPNFSDLERRWKPVLTGEYEDYSWLGDSVRAENVSDLLGDMTLELKLNGETAVCDAEIYVIKGIDPYYAVVLSPDRESEYFKNSNLTLYMLCYRREVKFETFTDLIEAYDLREQMYIGTVLGRMTKTEDGWEKTEEYYPQNVRFVNNLLASEGVSCEIPNIPDDCLSIGFDCKFHVAGGDFGMQIFENGYLMTNIGGTLHVFDIGEERAAFLIRSGRALPDNIGADIRVYEDGTKGIEDIKERETETSKGYISEEIFTVATKRLDETEETTGVLPDGEYGLYPLETIPE